MSFTVEDFRAPAHCEPPPPLARVATYPRFGIVGETNPPGMKPGHYFYVKLIHEDRKVSRYCRRFVTAINKRQQYERRWNSGERNWPAVGRVCELRDSKYAVPTRVERHLVSILAWFQHYGAMPHTMGVRLP